MGRTEHENTITETYCERQTERQKRENCLGNRGSKFQVINILILPYKIHDMLHSFSSMAT